jgi:hypothetical protein
MSSISHAKSVFCPVMQLRRASRPRAALSIAAALASACALTPAAASAYAPPSGAGTGALSPRLAELAKPSVRSAPQAAQARRLGLPSQGPGSLLREGSRVLVEVRFDRGAAAGVEDLRAAGAEIVNVSRRYQTVTVAAKPDELTQLPGVPRVAAAREVLTPIASASTCPSGVVVSEGDVQLRAAEARSTFGVDGSGTTVGILSDSFDHATESVEGGPVATHAAEDVETGDLPGAANTCSGESTPTNVLDDSDTEGEDEGRAMSQIVHDLAPGADLAFATAFTGETAFAENIEKLAKPSGEGGAGAQAIADDVTYFEEPFFQEGPVGVAASKVTEDRGVSYFSSAGNDNLIDGSGNDIASWEAPHFRDSGSCPTAVVEVSEEFEEEEGFGLETSHCMDFNPGAGTDTTFGIAVSPGASLLADLQWAEPWEGVDTDLDAYLIGPEGEVVAGSIGANIAEGRPFELVGWENESGSSANVRLVINRYEGVSPRLKFGLLENGGGVTATEYPESTGGDVVGPVIFGHNGGEDVNSVAAIPFDSTTTPEPYSSRGPVTHYFGPVTGGSTPAAPLGSPQVLSKPDMTATDCNATTFFAFEEEGDWRFCGTSAAAPHAAAVAALMQEEEPAATPAQIHTAIEEGASPIGAFGPCAVGAGLVDAVEAIERLLTPEGASIPACTPPFSPPVEEGEEGGGGGGGEGAPGPAPTPPAALPAPSPLPRIAIRKHPPHVVRTHGRKAKVVFQFGASARGVAFLCKVDHGPFRVCPAKFVHRFRVGKHILRVRARDAAGNVGPVVTFRFRVKRIGR